ncbi:MAG: DUF2971 domain-containing protein [Coriobacteriales bacterium]|jgi:hypothetical protein|nr:DUF2971 domain-containing protein [Coriobacteriales bacterium]
MWMTDTQFMSDKSEFLYGRRLAFNHFKPKLENFRNRKGNWDDDFIYFLDRDYCLYKSIDEIVDDFNSQADVARRRYFVISFCERPDLLSMWRGYSNDGVCLEFEINDSIVSQLWRSKDFIKNYKDIYPQKSCFGCFLADANFWLSKVVYSLNEQKAKLDNFANSFTNDLDYPSNKRTPQFEVFKEYYELLLSFKDHHFAEEKEYRLIFATGNSEFGKAPATEINEETVNSHSFNLEVRSTNHGVKPYFPMPIETFGKITGIFIGPGQNQENNFAAMRLAKITNHLDIQISSIPLNGSMKHVSGLHNLKNQSFATIESF